ncbi:hypothetical protein XENTR_v10011977 [Xenopus tropicalis]|uniref:Coiled-coil domain containing 24 n=1 Tax=Xenopus tropicalis TaxID=8364 RepID=A0A6I8SRF8_XENTR|nr:hypothetical protein XENTR_v10011977 [Xenopus tropicalis]
MKPFSDQDSGYEEILEPLPSLWGLVEQQVPVSERAEFKRILGEAAVDLSLELHAEFEVLLGLWRELRSNCLASSQASSSLHSISSLLADPPVIKDMVTQEIRMLLLAVRQKARQEGRPVSSLSTGSSIEDELEEIKEKLKVSDIDEVIAHLQSLLDEECMTLERDLAFLQQRLEEEHVYATEVQTSLPEPSLAELRQERRVIERDLQLNQLAVTSRDSQKNLKVSRSIESVPRIPSGSQKLTLSNRPLSGNLQGSERSASPNSPASMPGSPAAQRNSALSFAPVMPTSLIPSAPNQPKASAKLTFVGSEESIEKGMTVASHRNIKSTSAAQRRDPLNKCLSYDIPANPEPLATRLLGKVLPQDCVLTEQTQTLFSHGLVPQKLDLAFVPSPPAVQRPSNSSNSLLSLRRMRPQQSHS